LVVQASSTVGRGEDLEIGRILQLKSEIRNRKLDWPTREKQLVQVQSKISDFGFELREAQARQRAAPTKDSSNFKISRPVDKQVSGPRRMTPTNANA
jgi:hypothetical protein